MQSIYLCTHGSNAHEVPEELVRFLKFVKADLPGSQLDFKDGYIHRLQQTVENIKRSREQEERYMLFEELLEQERILTESDEKILDIWFEWAAMAVTVEEFQNKI